MRLLNADLAGTGHPEISPDGQQVAFLREQRLNESSIVVHSLTTGSERVVSDGNALFASGVHWFPDNRSLLVLDWADRSGPQVLQVDAASGRRQMLFRLLARVWSVVALSPDGTAVYYTADEAIDGRHGPGDLKRIRLVKHILRTGEETDVYETRSQGLGFFGLSVSPDGAWLAFGINVGDAGLNGAQALMVMPAGGGSPTVVRRWPDWQSFNSRGSLAWTPDSRHIIVTARCGPGAGLQLCAVAREGGPMTLVVRNMQDVMSRMISADGRHLAFTGTAPADAVLWIIPDLLANSLESRRP